MRDIEAICEAVGLAILTGVGILFVVMIVQAVAG
jgi:hypothetical protein